jgi:DNA polymerase III epsilon subunit-like protein
MPINQLDIVVFDLETTGLSWTKHEICEVGAKAYDGRTLEPYPDGEFSSLMKPERPEDIDEGALKVNGITREMLDKAPTQRAVWPEFVRWVARYNKKGSAFGAPMAGGKNILNFDLPFVHAINKLHGPKKEKTVIFNKHRVLDLELILWLWHFQDPDLPSLGFDNYREYAGMSAKSAHRALPDARQEGEVLMKYLKLHLELRRKKDKNGEPFIKLKGAFRG